MRRVIFAAVLVCLAAPGSALGQSRTLGSPLTQTPNTFGCETKPTFTEQSFDGNYRFLASGQPDCTWFQTGVLGNPSDPRTGAVPGDGRITNVAVRSGGNPALMRFTILRLFADSGSGSRQCCFFVSETQPVRPAPNSVMNFAVNLPVERNTNPANGLVTQDFIGVSAVSGSGVLPLFGNGSHNTISDYQNGNTTAGFIYPRLGAIPNDSGGGRREEGVPGFEVLMQWTWTPAGSPAPPTTPGAQPVGPGRGPVSLLGDGGLAARNGFVGLQVQCLLTRDCRGVALLRTRAGAAAAGKRRKSRVVGRKRIRIAGGKKARVRIRLNRRGRKLIRRGRLKAVAIVDLGAVGTVKKNVTLRRPSR